MMTYSMYSIFLRGVEVCSRFENPHTVYVLQWKSSVDWICDL